MNLFMDTSIGAVGRVPWVHQSVRRGNFLEKESKRWKFDLLLGAYIYIYMLAWAWYTTSPIIYRMSLECTDQQNTMARGQRVENTNTENRKKTFECCGPETQIQVKRESFIANSRSESLSRRL